MSFDVHPEMKPLIESRAALPAAKDLDEERKNWSAYARANAAPRPDGMSVEDRHIPGKGGHRIPVRVYTPAGGGVRPAILYFHGGGFVKGDCDTSDTTGWGLAEDTGSVCVSVDYRLAPEHRYPAALDDCLAALAYVQDNPGEYGVDPGRIAVVGDSAGGNLAAAVALAVRASGGPALRAQGLIYPCLTDRLEAQGYRRNAEAPGLTTSSMTSYWKAYLGEAKAGKSDDPLATPMVEDDLAGLPPAFVLVAEFDPLVDDGKAYAAKLIAAGVETGFRQADRMIHGFVRARLSGRDSGRAFAALARFLRAHLDG